MTPTQEFTFTPLRGAEWTARTTAMRKETWHEVQGPGVEVSVAIRLGVGPSGRLGCTGLLVGADNDHEVTARALRTIPLGQIMTAVASYLAGGESEDLLSRAIMKHYASQMLRDTAGELALTRRQRPGPAGWDNDHYRRVVEVYREALVAAPRSPVLHAAQVLQASESSLRRWLKTARDRGIAGASIPGQAGEAAPSKTSAPRSKRK